MNQDNKTTELNTPAYNVKASAEEMSPAVADYKYAIDNGMLSFID